MSAEQLLAGMRVSLTDIAEVAGVRRPVVSVWRSRYPAGPGAFPEPCERRGTQLMFRADEVASWIERTGLGNNGEFTTDVMIRALLESVPDVDLHLLTALLRLKATTGVTLAALAVDDMVDLADDADPDDLDCFSELDAAASDPDRLARLAALADQVADSAYTAGAALERILPRIAPAAAPLAPAALELLARIALTLHPGGPLTVTDPDPGVGEELVAVLGHEEHIDRARAVLPEPNGDSTARLLRRRLLTHGWEVTHAPMASGFARGAVVVGTLAREPGTGDVGVLERIDEIAVRLAPGQRAVVLGPARALIDEATPEVESVRSDLLRTDKVRAAVLLPPGLVPARSRERLAVWVLGDAHPDVPIADRWIMVADASQRLLRGGRLPRGVLEDILTDVLAAMGTRDQVRAHAFRFARFAYTSRILADRAGLLSTSRPVQRVIRDDVAAPARVRDLSRALAAATVPDIGVRVRAGEPVMVRQASLAELIEHRALGRLPGHRVEGIARPATGAVGEVPVLGDLELSGEGRRAVDRLELAATCPASRLTEPGDVVFTSSPRPAAMVDADGLSVVAYPAQVLRVRARDVGLVPEMIAAEINRAEPGSRWRDWQVRLTPPGQAEALAGLLDRIGAAQAAAREQLRLLTELTTEVTAGVSAGVVRLVDDEPDHPEEE